MGTPLRDSDPATVHLITNRTEGAFNYLRPSKDVNKIIGGVYARYQEILKVTLFAYTVMSNHQHLLAQAPLGNLDEFMENVNREIARRINYKLGRQGRLWSRRYRAQAVTTEEDLLEAFLYVTTNAVKHGAARHPSLWPGLNSYQQSLSEEAKTYSFHHYSEREKDKRVTYHDLIVSPLPTLISLSASERKKHLIQIIDARTTELVETRESQGQWFATPEQVRALDPFSTPRKVNRTPTGNCYSKDPEVIRRFKQSERARRAAYDQASFRFRLGELTVTFPPHTFKPPLHRKPRFIPFTPLSDEFLLQKFD